MGQLRWGTVRAGWVPSPMWLCPHREEKSGHWCMQQKHQKKRTQMGDSLQAREAGVVQTLRGWEGTGTKSRFQEQTLQWADTAIWDFWPPEPWDDKFSCLSCSALWHQPQQMNVLMCRMLKTSPKRIKDLNKEQKCIVPLGGKTRTPYKLHPLPR